MNNEIKVGDFVKLKNGLAGYIYKVTCAEEDVPRIGVDYKQNVFSTLGKAEVEKIDPKTAFLSELKGLLEKYDAKINFGFKLNDEISEREIGTLFQIGDDKNNRVWYPVKLEAYDTDPTIVYQMPRFNYPLTASNIMDYDKE